ncbi:DegT/DnrJ/EryC1/StrS aminotransferase [Acidovorax delafieldii 2AN]|uniref:DegT/DnrJ/EryC1/StrS aminotransferase n=1 Tax=Acidovorax delafieldii 2AN TaxID=573060 RepID=C5T0P3_ACIDE|nr:DegT/DnrJ/EryC1/StrS family aminotransferase [Acidovorax delafieldii]EER61948.1 DegT/DnrJ/EryC1/StrS aminotransferase [Acidovorax delafieldii 2AN]
MIKINDLSALTQTQKEGVKNAVARVVDSGWVVLGPEVRHFESAFADYLGARHCAGVANGTDAIELALKALGVAVGDRVATVANAGMYTSAAVLAIGAEPVFMDVDLDSRNVALPEVRRVIALGVKAVVATHLYGLAVAEIEAIAQLCAQHGVALLEDCAQAHGAIVSGRRVGTFGDAASFSFYPTKNLGALGDGGAVVTQRADVAERVGHLRQYGWTAKYQVSLPGGRNSRLDEMQAAILMVFLPHLDAANARRRQIAARYGASIHHPDVQLPMDAGESSVAHLYVLRSARREALRAHLQAQGISSDVHYPIPDHRQPVFGDRYAGLRLENTERLAAEILTLPCYAEMRDEDVARVVAAVNGWRA